MLMARFNLKFAQAMKSFKIIFALFTALLLSGPGGNHPASAQPGITVSFQSFYTSLSPYGRWMNNPQYGSVWIPNINGDFHPYQTNGRWVMTEYGNTWVSNYEWGWAPFHYGRWFLDDFYGWIWVPGYEWGPGWVNWRTGGGYYGWAPLGPGIHVNVVVDIPLRWWCFVPQIHFSSMNWYNYCLPRTRVVNVYHQTTIINNYYRNDNRVYAYGPRRSEIEKVTRSSVPVYQYSRNDNREVLRESNPRAGRPEGQYSSRGGYTENEPVRSGSRAPANREERSGSYEPRDYSTSGRGSYTEPAGASGESRPATGRTSPSRETGSPAPRDYNSRRGSVESSPGSYRTPERSAPSPATPAPSQRGSYESSRQSGGAGVSAPRNQAPAPSVQSRGGSSSAQRGASAPQGRAGSRGGN